MDALRTPGPLVTVELRPPRTDLSGAEGMSAWIDLHHTLGRLTRQELFVFLTDNAVGAAEEENLAHVGGNVGDSVELSRIVPILTCKHTLQYCETFAVRAASDGFESLTVLGGDVSVPPPRCVPHGRDLREILSSRVPSLTLGGWVNPHRSAEEQVAFINAPDANADYALSQIVSHHSTDAVERFSGGIRPGRGPPNRLCSGSSTTGPRTPAHWRRSELLSRCPPKRLPPSSTLEPRLRRSAPAASASFER